MNNINNKSNSDVITFDHCNEISIGELIYEIDNSNQIHLYKMGSNNRKEKNILIQIKKENK